MPKKVDSKGPIRYPPTKIGIHAKVIERGFISIYPKNEKDINNSAATKLPKRYQYRSCVCWEFTVSLINLTSPSLSIKRSEGVVPHHVQGTFIGKNYFSVTASRKKRHPFCRQDR